MGISQSSTVAICNNTLSNITMCQNFENKSVGVYTVLIPNSAVLVNCGASVICLDSSGHIICYDLIKPGVFGNYRIVATTYEDRILYNQHTIYTVSDIKKDCLSSCVIDLHQKSKIL